MSVRVREGGRWKVRGENEFLMRMFLDWFMKGDVIVLERGNGNG